MVTDKQAVEAIKTIKEFCWQKDVEDCTKEKCCLYEFCVNIFEELPVDWQIPQLGGEEE